MATLAVVVNSLKHFESLHHGVRELARRHVAYGVTPAHYEKVGAALIWTLEQGLGDGFTPETRAAWIETYGVLSQLMIEAAYGTETAKGAA
jgi:nitric oxide dioxygenase